MINLDTGQLKLTNLFSESKMHLKLNANDDESVRDSSDFDLDSFTKTNYINAKDEYRKNDKKIVSTFDKDNKNDSIETMS